MSPAKGEGMDEPMEQCHNLPSIPVLGCRWGLGEGVSPMVFKPIVIPKHLLRSADDAPESSRRLRGRGRAAGLSCHDDPLPLPGEYTNVGVSSLSTREQIDRVRGELPIYDFTNTDYEQYILPNSKPQDDEEPAESETRSAQPPPSPPRPVVGSGASAAGPSRRGGWEDFLDPGGAVTAVESALLPQNMAGGGDAGQRTPERPGLYTAVDSDGLELCTSSSDQSDGFGRLPRYRPRPPAMNKESFPPLPGAQTSSRERTGSSAAQSSPERQSLSSAGTDSSPSKPARRRGGRGRKKRAAAEPQSGASRAAAPAAATVASPAAAPAAATAATPPPTSGAAGDSGAAAEGSPSGRVLVSGVTDGNWLKVTEYVTLFGTVEKEGRGPGGDGWIVLSPPESAAWVVSVHTTTACDIEGVTFRLPDDESER